MLVFLLLFWLLFTAYFLLYVHTVFCTLFSDYCLLLPVILLLFPAYLERVLCLSSILALLPCPACTPPPTIPPPTPPPCVVGHTPWPDSHCFMMPPPEGAVGVAEVVVGAAARWAAGPEHELAGLARLVLMLMLLGCPEPSETTWKRTV
jgi:hypothetical protein